MRMVMAFLLLALTASVSFAAGVVNLGAPAARSLLARNGRVLLLDVRTPEEYRQAHLRGATLIPLSELESRVREIPRGRPILVYCAVGARSLTAAHFLVSKGFSDVYHISDGIVGWYRNGYPLERGK